MSAASASASDDVAPADSRRWWILLLLALAQFMVVLDASITNVALPTIKSALGLSDQAQQWVINAYVLTFGGFLLLGGRAADLFGRRRLFVGGLVLFGAASLAGGLATNGTVLIAARAVQGLGAAIIAPAALSIVTVTFREGRDRNAALGVWGAVAGAGGAAGVLLGGVLTEYLGWEWVLFVNVPIAAAVAVTAPFLVAESRHEGARGFDLPGAVLITGGLTLLVYGIVESQTRGWDSPVTLGLIGGAVVAIAAFQTVEARIAHPLVRLGIFRLRTLSSANVVGLLLGASLFSMFYFISLYMQNVLGYSALKAGIAYLPLALAIFVSAGLASALVTRFGAKPILALGMAFTAVGLFGFSLISPGGSYLADVLWPSLFAAVGLGFAFVPVTIAAVAKVGNDEQGLASGLINTAQQIGGALGLSVLASFAFPKIGDALATGTPPPVALTDGYSLAFSIGAGLAVLGLIVVLVAVRGEDTREVVEANEGAAVPAAG